MKKLTLLFIVIYVSCSALAAQIAGGGNHSLALKENGTVWAWGEGRDGSLGDGTGESRLTPVQVSGLTDVISISAGSRHSLALKRDGTVWAWGRNDYGELGDGTDERRYSPVQVVGLSGVIAISAGDYFSLAVKNDGKVWAWGENFFGKLGDGTTTHRTTPVQVVGFSDAIAVSAGDYHSLALKRDGTVWAWGLNAFGQFGNGTTDNRLTPVQVSGLSNVISINAGRLHSLALKRDGTVWAWGDNWSGQLGDGNSRTNSLTPVQSLVSGVIAIDGGEFYSLALSSYGIVWFWGYIQWGWQDYIELIIPVPFDGISGVKAIACGNEHALFLKNDGTVWAWGDNLAGELGDGTTTTRRYPVQVQGFSTGGSASPPASILAADFDGDGRADPTAVQAPSTSSGQAVNAWYFWYSSQSYSREGPIELGMTGTSPDAEAMGDKPAAGDVDGDGRADMALVEAPSTGSGQAVSAWYFWLSSRGYSLSESVALGVSGSPVLADFDGDRKADPAMYEAASGKWQVFLSADGYSQVSAPFAVAGATPLAADFDGDGRADPVMVSANGGWYFWFSSSMYIRAGPYNFGLTGPGSAEASKPVAGDFDGDGKADPAMMDSSGNWYFWLSGSFYTRAGPFYLVLP